MGVSLDQLPYDSATIYTDRWLFQLSDELRGPHGGAVFDLGVVTEPVDTRVLRRFICAHGKAMVGALRVVGEPCELGDCSALKPPSAEPAPVSVKPAALASFAEPSQPPEPARAHRGEVGEPGIVATADVTAPSQPEPPPPSQRPSSAVDSVRPSGTPSAPPSAPPSALPSVKPSAFEGSTFDPVSGTSRQKGKPSK